MERDKVYQIVTDKVLDALKAGVVPWKRGWLVTADGGLPIRGSNGKPYRGINILLLGMEAWAKGYTSPFWFSFNQALALDACVRKGQHGTTCVFWKRVFVKPDEDAEEDGAGDRKAFMVMRSYTVFNGDQVDGLPEKFTPKPAPKVKGKRFVCDAGTDAVAAAYLKREKVGYEEKGNRARYCTAEDKVYMPPRQRFLGRAEYYGAKLHELTHSTGTEKRLARPGFASYRGGPDYSFEELVAELGACFGLAEHGIAQDGQQANSAAYIKGWLEPLREDPRFVVRAAAKATAAMDFIHGRKFEVEENGNGNGGNK